MEFENEALMTALRILVGGVLPAEARLNGHFDAIFDPAEERNDPLMILGTMFAPFAAEAGVDFLTVLGAAIMVVRDKPELFRTRILEARKKLASLRERKI